MGKFGKRIVSLASLIPRYLSPLNVRSKFSDLAGLGSIGGSPVNLAISTHVCGKEKELEILAASHIGRAHRIEHSPRQDAFFVFQWGPFVVAGISDGVSSSKYSHLGAQIIAEHAPFLIVEILKSRVGNIPITWDLLNSDISKKIVAEYVTWKKRSGETFSLDINALREEAANSFAATLEFLVVDTTETESEDFSYLFVRVAGDGDLVLINNSRRLGIQSLVLGDSLVKGDVGALPAFDGAPFTLSGTLSKGQTLLLCTDGIGDFIRGDKTWLRKMNRVARRRWTTHASLADFISYSPEGAFDDQTAVFIKL